MRPAASGDATLLDMSRASAHLTVSRSTKYPSNGRIFCLQVWLIWADVDTMRHEPECELLTSFCETTSAGGTSFFLSHLHSRSRSDARLFRMEHSFRCGPRTHGWGSSRPDEGSPGCARRSARLDSDFSVGVDSLKTILMRAIVRDSTSMLFRTMAVKVCTCSGPQEGGSEHAIGLSYHFGRCQQVDDSFHGEVPV